MIRNGSGNAVLSRFAHINSLPQVTTYLHITAYNEIFVFWRTNREGKESRLLKCLNVNGKVKVQVLLFGVK